MGVEYGPYGKSSTLGKGKGGKGKSGLQLGPYASQTPLNKQKSHRNNGGMGKKSKVSY